MEVLSGYRIEAVSRKQGLSPKTLGNWVRQYQDELDDLMIKKRNQADPARCGSVQDLQKKYEDAVKLLDEKELQSIFCGSW